MRLLLKYKLISGSLFILALVYLAQTVLIDTPRAILDKYHITNAQAHALTMTIYLPYVIIWLVALLGYLRFRHYSDSIRGSSDGAAFAKIATGLWWLVLWMPISAIASALGMAYYKEHAAATDTVTILNNYLNLVILFVGFVYIFKGSKKLLKLIKRPVNTDSLKVNLAYISFAALYVLLVLNDPARRVTTDTVSIASYYQPDWLIVLTIIIPRLIMWYIGIQAIQNILLYRLKVKGSLYKQSLNSLALGIGWVVFTTIVFRCIQSLSSPIGHLNLGLLLALLYALLILLSVGFVLIARGARNLQKLEEL